MALLEAAKAAYRAGHEARALELHQQARALAVGPVEFELASRRVATGLTRAGRHREAKEVIEELCWTPVRGQGALDERVRLLNTLATAQMRVGDLGGALDTLRWALSLAAGPELNATRARVHGSFGSFWERLGARSRADECYARSHELTLALGLEKAGHELTATACGLFARTATARRDFELARELTDQESRAAELSRDRATEWGALYHRGTTRLSEGRAETEDPDRRAGLLRDAVGFLRDARANAETDNERARAVHRIAQAELAAGLMQAGCSRMQEAHRLASKANNEDLRAQTRVDLADACQRCGLDGEAICYLDEAMRIREGLHGGLPEEIRALGQSRWDELTDLARKLLSAAGALQPTHEDKTILDRVRSRYGLESAPLQTTDRQTFEGRWRTSVLPGTWDKLYQASREDLVRADIVYHGSVDDLGRSAHLLIVVVERELRERLWRPVADWVRSEGVAVPKSLKSTLGWNSFSALLDLIEFIVTPDPDDSKGAAVRARWQPMAERLRRIAERLKEQVEVVDSSETVGVRDLRNAIVHGNQLPHALSRRHVDAIRRHLTMVEPVLLAEICSIEVPGA